MLTLQAFQSRLSALCSEVGGIDLVDRSELVQDCYTDALDEIYTVLVQRGYTATQIATWVRLDAYHNDIGVWNFLSKVLAARQENVPAFIQELGLRREELRSTELLDENYELIEAADEPSVDITCETRQFTQTTEW